MHVARRRVMQQVQEVTGETVVVGLRIDAFAVCVESVPVQEDRRETGEEAVGGVRLVRKVALRFDIAEE